MEISDFYKGKSNPKDPWADPKPMLAETIKDLSKVKYPVLATPKIDGIRCLTFEGGRPLSRSLKDIPNKFVQDKLLAYGVEGLDGELWIRGAGYFGEVSSAIMRESGEPDFEYIVFDLWKLFDTPYSERYKMIESVAKKPRPDFIKILNPVLVTDAEGLSNYMDKCIDDGYEGVVTRKPISGYKYGRSAQGVMMKLKVEEDSEAEVIGFEELMHNANEAKRNELGRTERSSAKAGKVPAGTLGKFLVRDLKTGVEFEVGTGFTASERQKLWNSKRMQIGKIIKYKYQPAGMKNKPRNPVFLSFRHKDDM